MAISLSSPTIDAMLAAIVDQLDADVSVATLEIGATGMASVLVAFDLGDPSGTVSANAITFDVADDGRATATGTGTAAAARLKDGAGNVIASGITVGAPSSGEDIEISSTDISSGDVIDIASAQFTLSIA